VLLDANLLTDVANVRHIRAVVVGGHFLDMTQVDKRLAEVKFRVSQ